MREIKFDIKIRHIETGNTFREVFTLDEIISGSKLYAKGIQEVVFKRQFTGLKDKNGEGMDVFGGDIFEAVFKDCPDGFSMLGKETKVIFVKAIVVFKFGAFYVEIIDPITKQTIYKLLSLFLQNEEKVVIGNIYDGFIPRSELNEGE